MTDGATAQAENPFAKKTKTASKTAPTPIFPPTEVTSAAPDTVPDPVEEAAPVAAAPPPMPGKAALPAPGAPAATFPVPGSAPVPAAPAATTAPPPPMSTAQANPYGGEDAGNLGDDFEFDLTDVKSGGGGYIGPGKHALYVSGISEGIAQSSGNRKIIFEFTVASGEYAGRKRSAHCAITPAAMWKIEQILGALGLIDDTSRKLNLGQIRTYAPGRICIAEFVASTYNGNPSSDMGNFFPPTELGIETGTTMQGYGS